MGARLAAHIRARPDLDPADVASASAARARLDRRAVVVGEGREELLAGLDSLAAGRPGAGVHEAAVAAAGGNLAFLFTGQGAQRVGMGRELDLAAPVFTRQFDRLCAELDPHLPEPLAPIVLGERADAADLLDRTEFTQPALFALEVALYRLLEQADLRPDFLLGHSVGEIAAAHVAGVLSLENACTLVAARGRLMGRSLPAGRWSRSRQRRRRWSR